MGGSDFDRAIAQIDDHITAIGDEIDDAVYHPDNPGQTIGYDAVHGQWKYHVRGDPDLGPVFEIAFPFSIVSNVKGILDDESANEIHNDPDGLTGEKLHHEAAIQLLHGIHDHQMESFKYHLINKITTTDASYSVESPDGTVVGFQVSRKYYPLDEGGTLSEFSHSVQTVISAGINGIRFSAQSFDFDTLIEDLTGTSDDLRYIQ